MIVTLDAGLDQTIEIDRLAQEISTPGRRTGLERRRRLPLREPDAGAG
jgi:hypothetical protein